MIELFEPRTAGVRRWGVALGLGLALHAGAAFMTVYGFQKSDEQDQFAGPIAIELAPLPVAPMQEQFDLPIGPRAEETPAVADAPKEAKVAKAEEAPVVPASPYEPDDPDLRMAIANPDRKTDEPKEDEATTDQMVAPALSASVPVPESTAPPPVVAPPAPVAAAPEAGMSEAQRQAIARWQKTVVVHLNKYKRFPADARRRQIQGDVTIRFTIDRGGRVISSSVVTSAGSGLLDAAALDILQRAGPLPRPPAHMPGKTFDLSLPIRYRVK